MNPIYHSLMSTSLIKTIIAEELARYYRIQERREQAILHTHFINEQAADAGGDDLGAALDDTGGDDAGADLGDDLGGEGDDLGDDASDLGGDDAGMDDAGGGGGMDFGGGGGGMDFGFDDEGGGDDAEGGGDEEDSGGGSEDITAAEIPDDPVQGVVDNVTLAMEKTMDPQTLLNIAKTSIQTYGLTGDQVAAIVTQMKTVNNTVLHDVANRLELYS